MSAPSVTLQTPKQKLPADMKPDREPWFFAVEGQEILTC
jgi:hypothetical protein